ncbi:hypothetical protein HYC85_004885 [Camellia sinensis]|uniref:Lon N-terminal domain-containing protein n=1 Tax=Camellia sinensis TaxID=4442 RepID=A0A7J7HXU0_CAMSI|nr:hypothetical protein HYC85_004885 [Camellia sinensis]
MKKEASSILLSSEGLEDVDEFVGASEVGSSVTFERFCHVSDLMQIGNLAFRENRFEEAINCYSRANTVKPGDPIILSNRCAAYLRICQFLKHRPPSASEHKPLTGLDPTIHAELALKDAEKVIKFRNGSVKSYILKANALILLEKYELARDVILLGLQIDPSSNPLKALERTTASMIGKRDHGKPERTDDFDCTLCLNDERRRRLVQPSVPSVPPILADQMALAASSGSQSSISSVTCHHCGAPRHVKARCFKLHPALWQRPFRPCGPALRGFGSARTVALLEVTPASKPLMSLIYSNYRLELVSFRLNLVLFTTGSLGPSSSTATLATGPDVTLNNIIQKNFPEEYAERKDDNDSLTNFGGDLMPLFVMDVVLPCQKFHLNIFEPRYRLMVRRIMEGNRRMGMVITDTSTGVSHSQMDASFWRYRVAEIEWVKDIYPSEGTRERADLQEMTNNAAGFAQSWMKTARDAAQQRQDRSRLVELDKVESMMPTTGDPERYSFWLATLTNRRPSERLELLSLRDTNERIRRALVFMRAEEQGCRLQ